MGYILSGLALSFSIWASCVKHKRHLNPNHDRQEVWATCVLVLLRGEVSICSIMVPNYHARFIGVENWTTSAVVVHEPTLGSHRRRQLPRARVQYLHSSPTARQ